LRKVKWLRLKLLVKRHAPVKVTYNEHAVSEKTLVNKDEGESEGWNGVGGGDLALENSIRMDLAILGRYLQSAHMAYFLVHSLAVASYLVLSVL
jgi:hypothetical protein